MPISSASVEMTESVRAGIDRIAVQRGTTSGAVLATAVEVYVLHQEQLEQTRREILASWKDYEETGLHVTGEKMDEWFEKVERGENPPLPQCHT